MKAGIIGILIISLAVTLSAADASLPPGHERYIVVLQARAQGVAAEAEKSGGKVEADLGNRLVITAPPAAIETLRKHAAVRYVQKVVVGVTQAAPEGPEIRASAIHAPVQSDSGLTWTSGDYSYDGAGNIMAIGTVTAPGTQGYRTYGYDAVTRLKKAEIGVTPNTTYEYGYDVYGNRTENIINAQSVTVPVSPTTNRLTDATYDASGNQLYRGATVATYDGFDMVTSYRFDSLNVETFVYTANDERIGALRGNEWTWSLRDGGGKVLRQYRSSSTSPSAAWLWVEDYVYRDGLLLGSERVAEEGGRRHYHLDHLGSARLVTGTTGSVISEHDFLPFGGERTMIGQHLARGFDREEPMRFTGHERDFDNTTPNDSSAYIDYMHARYYAANTGRFLSPDPVLGNLLQPQSWNRYAYVVNNPLNLTDPSGMKPANGDRPTRPVPGEQCPEGAVQPCFTFQLEESEEEREIRERGERMMFELQMMASGLTDGMRIDRQATLRAQAARGDEFAMMQLGITPPSLEEDYSLYFIMAGIPTLLRSAVRTEARNLAEHLTMQEARGGAGEQIMKGAIKDLRYPSSTWAKMQHVHTTPTGVNITIHYWRNILTGVMHGFKFTFP